MKQYTADKHAQYTLQIATPIVTAVLIGLVWYFLAVLPHWLLWTLTAVLAAAAILLSTLLLPNLGAIIRFCSVMLIIPLVWLLCIRIVAMFTESVTMDDQHLQMHFCSWFTFHTITVNHARIVRTDLMQTPAQKMYGVCHLYITGNGPRQQRFKLTALPEAKAREIVETLARTEMQDMS